MGHMTLGQDLYIVVLFASSMSLERKGPAFGWSKPSLQRVMTNHYLTILAMRFPQSPNHGTVGSGLQNRLDQLQ